MATLDDILTLARAGFNAEQIGALLQPAQDPAPQPEPPAPQPETQPAAPAPETQPDPYAKLMEELGAIKAQIQSNNRSQAQQPPDPQQLSGDQILANIIAPPRRSQT